MSLPVMMFSFTGPVLTVTGGTRSEYALRAAFTKSVIGASFGSPNIIATRE